MQRMFYIPPGGSLGASANTLAGQASLMGRGPAMRSTGVRRRKKRVATSTKRKMKRASTKRGVKMRKGSAAAKAWGRKMARLRK